jgi:hypothetical protein
MTGARAVCPIRKKSLAAAFNPAYRPTATWRAWKVWFRTRRTRRQAGPHQHRNLAERVLGEDLFIAASRAGFVMHYVDTLRDAGFVCEHERFAGVRRMRLVEQFQILFLCGLRCRQRYLR